MYTIDQLCGLFRKAAIVHTKPAIVAEFENIKFQGMPILDTPVKYFKVFIKNPNGTEEVYALYYTRWENCCSLLSSGRHGLVLLKNGKEIKIDSKLFTLDLSLTNMRDVRLMYRDEKIPVYPYPRVVTVAKNTSFYVVGGCEIYRIGKIPFVLDHSLWSNRKIYPYEKPLTLKYFPFGDLLNFNMRISALPEIGLWVVAFRNITVYLDVPIDAGQRGTYWDHLVIDGKKYYIVCNKTSLSLVDEYSTPHPTAKVSTEPTFEEIPEDDLIVTYKENYFMFHIGDTIMTIDDNEYSGGPVCFLNNRCFYRTKNSEYKYMTPYF